MLESDLGVGCNITCATPSNVTHAKWSALGIAGQLRQGEVQDSDLQYKALTEVVAICMVVACNIFFYSYWACRPYTTHLKFHIDFSEATYTVWLLRNYRTRCKLDNFRLRDEQSLQLGVYVQPYSTQYLQQM